MTTPNPHSLDRWIEREDDEPDDVDGFDDSYDDSPPEPMESPL
jgi:hypothetical protein